MKYIVWGFFFCIHLQAQNVDFKQLNAVVSFDIQEEKVVGQLEFEFFVNVMVDTIKIDAKNMNFSQLKINKKTVDFVVNATHLCLYEGFKKGKNKLSFSYEAKPKQALYFVGKDENLQIWTQGQGKYTSHWLPSFDDVNEKLVFNISVTVSDDFTALSNGVLKKKTKQKSGAMMTWHYEMKKPMSSYLVMIAAGKFDEKTVKTNSKTPLFFYLPKQHETYFEPTFRYSKQLFDFLESEIGVAYPWQVYRQVAIKDFIYAGMENTTSTIFSNDFVVDSIGFQDKTYCNVNAHELAHQWFGNLVTAESGKHHWLQEGFATYYALLAEEHIFGSDYFNWELYNMAERLKIASKEDTIPLLNPKASSLTFYQKGAWALHYLRTKVGGKVFQSAVQSYLKKNAFSNVTTEQFLAEIKEKSGYDVEDFQKRWLESAELPIDDMLEILRKNVFIKDYFSLLALQNMPFADKKVRLENFMEMKTFYPIQEEVLYQINQVSWDEKKNLIKKGFQNPNLTIRQTVARTLTEIPIEIKPDFESLLKDDSYITQEIALGALWNSFPNEQIKYLNISKNWVGFQDKNLRILWLTLALMTPDFENNRKPNFYDELLSYASPNYESAIRQNAFTNLLFLNPLDENVLRDLIQATTHHKWQFTLFARNQIRSLLKNEAHLNFFKEVLPTLNQAEQNQLKKLVEF
uniref:M1 family metallopeptidase n=3 Tax=Flavobacterium sp. TaxID=239 RepID=UPI00404A9C2A